MFGQQLFSCPVGGIEVRAQNQIGTGAPKARGIRGNPSRQRYAPTITLPSQRIKQGHVGLSQRRSTEDPPATPQWKRLDKFRIFGITVPGRPAPALGLLHRLRVEVDAENPQASRAK
ncbi:MAG: hypothetical protein OEV36_12200, partial [Myxococcales bacterium]|nr:hypothetical protein [Myxococcales bacterium]